MSKLFIFIFNVSFKYFLFNYFFLFLSTSRGFSRGFSSIKSLTSILLSSNVFMSKTKYKMGTCFSSSKYLLNMSVKILRFLISNSSNRALKSCISILSLLSLIYIFFIYLILFFKEKKF